MIMSFIYVLQLTSRETTLSGQYVGRSFLKINTQTTAVKEQKWVQQYIVSRSTLEEPCPGVTGFSNIAFYYYCMCMHDMGEGGHAMACVWKWEANPIGLVLSSYLYVASRVILGAWWQIPLPTVPSCWLEIHIEDRVSLLAHNWTLEFYPHFHPFGCILVWCAYVCGDQRSPLRVIAPCPLLYLLRQGLSLNPELTVYLACLSILPQSLPLMHWDSWVLPCLPSFYVDAGVLNSSPHTSMANALPTEPSPHPSVHTWIKVLEILISKIEFTTIETPFHIPRSVLLCSLFSTLFGTFYLFFLK